MQHLGGPPRTPSTRGEGGLEARLSCWSLLAPAPVPRRPPLPPTTSGRGFGFPLPPRGQQCPHGLSHLPGKPCGRGPSRRPARSAQSVGPAQPPAPPQVCPSHPAPPTRLCGSSLLASPSPLPAARLKGGSAAAPGGDHQLGVEAVRRPRLPRGWDGGRLLLYGVSGGGAADRGDAVPPAPDSDFSFLHVSGGGGQETLPSEVGSVPRGLAAAP